MYVPKRTDKASPVDIPMTPMIDVVFLLIIFFILTAGFRKAEESLPTKLTMPLAGGAARQPQNVEVEELEEVVVKIDVAEGKVGWLIGEARQPNLPAVGRTLKLLADHARDELPVILDSDGEVPLSAVVEVYDVCRLAGFTQINFAALAENPGAGN